MNKYKMGPLALAVALMSGAYAASAQTVNSCGYTVQTGIYSSWSGGYQGWVSVNNVSGDAASDFEVLINTGSGSISSGYNADFSNSGSGTVASAPDWLRWSVIQPGSSFQFGFLGSGEYSSINAKLLSVNGVSCGTEPPPPPPPPEDTIKPEVGLSANQIEFTAPGNLVLDAFAVDNVGVTKVVFMRDGQVIGEDSSDPYSYQVAITDNDQNGVAAFSAVAYDAAGNAGTSNTFNVNIALQAADTINPEVGLSANQFEFTAPGNLVLDAFAVDNVGVAKVVFLRDGQVIGEDSSSPYSFEVAIGDDEPNGVSTFSAVAYDAAGNTGESNDLNISIALEAQDTISPQAGLSVNNVMFTSPGTLQLSAFGADNVGVVKMVFKRDGVVIGEDTTEPFGLNIDVSSLPNGTSSYSATAFDAAGNSGDSNAISVTIALENQDTIKPDVGLAADKNSVNAPGQLTLMAFAVDNVGVDKVVFSRDGEVIGEDSTDPYTFDVTIGGGASGTTIFTATAYDTSGNTNVSNEISVSVTSNDRFLGTAAGSEADFTGAASYFNQITPANAGKWGSVEAERDVMDWTALDTAYTYAKEHGMPFKLHTLVWGQQAPAWIDDLSPNEQIAEVSQWMSALAERYPDVDMIDVVNEPLHAPASYREALGGEGASGWDWVITAFAMARSYFPNAELLINDYNVLAMESFTQDYLDVVETVGQTGLLDGIGVQAHFLERADIPVIESNLQTLADTGLPIYISELEVNIADDAHHANVLKDLFTAFWENPAVAGVTHWGYRQGAMWRENGYLVRSDGTLRPGMEWLMCYYGGGSNCTVPEYIPSGWSGDEYGLTLQAEEYDSAEGLLAMGSSVAYTDDGDWLGFYKVNFDASWNKIWLTYMKGNDAAGSVSVYLDSLTSDPVLTLDLAATADWNTAATLEADWAAITGEHDLYVRFNGTSGVGNLDKIRIGVPTISGLGPNLVDNGDFEAGHASGWFSWDGDVGVSSTVVYDGNYSLQLTNRDGDGPAAYPLFDKVTAGSTYQVNLQVSISGADSADVNITQKIACEGEDDSYSWLVSPATITSGEWVQMSGELVVPDCTLTDIMFYAEGPDGGIDIYLDDVSVKEVVTSTDTGM